jgi:succinate dehydrogenase/fumarate reductase flavoprotein subunit
MPGALHTQPIAPPQPTFAPGQFDGRVDGAMHARVDGSASRVDARVDGRVAEEEAASTARTRAEPRRAQAEERRGILFDEVIPAPDAANPYARLRLGAPRVERE